MAIERIFEGNTIDKTCKTMNLTRNRSPLLLFPCILLTVLGTACRIVIKSNYVNGSTKRKEPVYTYSDVITVA
ncbi:MAG: hypothetical protein IJ630_05040 [Treponema sp.]|nr:hypothetical protein [Treponema sp.]